VCQVPVSLNRVYFPEYSGRYANDMFHPEIPFGEMLR
jgi:hypothetical protein